jgi:CheY-like chemotaxis protein
MFARARADGPAEWIDLGILLQEVTQLTAPRWRDTPQQEGRPIDLRTEAVEDAHVMGWPSRLREVLTNLIFNAVDALPNGGAIDLRAQHVGDSIVVEVADSGVGMPPAVRERIFDPFFSTKEERGTGLGLTMVLATIEQHGGQIAVDSTPGHGTTFRITLPAAHETTAPVAEESEERGARPLRILAVDDQPALARMVALMLEPSGHTVSIATSGEEALERLRAAPFDMVITDLGLGAGMNGWELAEQVKRGRPDVRIVLATGWGAAVDPSEASAREIEAVIAKPYRRAALEHLLGERAADGPSIVA